MSRLYVHLHCYDDTFPFDWLSMSWHSKGDVVLGTTYASGARFILKQPS